MEAYTEPEPTQSIILNSTQNLALSTIFMKANRLSNDYHDFLRSLYDHIDNRSPFSFFSFKR
jgi:hypothetical protein